VTADAPSTEAEQPSADAARSEAALSAYRLRMRRARLRYAAVLAVIVAAVAVAVSVAWSRGEIAHTSSKPTDHPAPSIAVQQPAASVTRAWTSTDHTAIGTPYWGGTVITYSTHTVSGRNGATGAVVWSYSRSDRVVCTAGQTQGITIAIYMLHGNCDEVTALDSQTGKRDWVRTLDENGQPILGQPTYQVTPSTFMVISPSVIYAFNTDHSGIYAGSDRFVFGQTGCTIHDAVLGTAGALISQTCNHPNCAGLTFCHAGAQLLLRDGTNGYNDDDQHKADPDQITWNLAGNTDRPASADSVISAFTPDSHTLQVFDPDKGKVTNNLALSPAPQAISTVTATPTSDRELIWAGGVSYAIRVSPTAALLWQQSTPVTPTVTSTDPKAIVGLPDVLSSIVAVPGSGGVAVLDRDTGRAERVVPVPGISPGQVAYPFGAGFVLAGPATAVYR
jgi:PQQ-like domain